MKRFSLSSMRPFLPALALLTLCAILPAAYLPVSGQAFGGSAAVSAALYHFTHASILHLLANTVALLYFRPRWTTAIVAYLSASLAALSPFTYLALPTCGLSGLICAAFARRYVAWNKNPLLFIGINLPFALLPNFNYRIHILSFILAYILWKIVYHLKAGRKS